MRVFLTVISVFFVSFFLSSSVVSYADDCKTKIYGELRRLSNGDLVYMSGTTSKHGEFCDQTEGGATFFKKGSKNYRLLEKKYKIPTNTNELIPATFEMERWIKQCLLKFNFSNSPGKKIVCPD